MPLNFNKYYYLPLSLSLSLAAVISAVIQNMADDVVLQEAITNEIFQEQSCAETTLRTLSPTAFLVLIMAITPRLISISHITHQLFFHHY